MLEKIKVLRGIEGTKKDALLNYLIDDCKADAVNYCNLAEYNDSLDPVVTQMVLEKYNRMGNEGVQAVSYSGVSETYGDDYSAGVYRALKKHRRLKTLTRQEAESDQE